MGIFKEEIKFLEGLELRQSRIYADACDKGIYLNDMSEEELNRLRDVVQELLELPGSEVVLKMDSPIVQREYSLIVMWGHCDDVRWDATEVQVLYVNDTARKKEFFSITTHHVFTDKNGKKL